MIEAPLMSDLFLGALDIGGTKLAASVASWHGPLARLSCPTPKAGDRRALPEQAATLLEDACHEAGIAPTMLHAVGVAACGPFVCRDGMTSLAAPNLCGRGRNSPDLPNDWDVIPLQAVLKERFAHVVVENDAVAALVAERSFGALQSEDHCAYLTWSTGIGVGLCVDGHILRGKNGNAGHAGHMLMDPASQALCGCGNRGDLEGMVSGRNLGAQAGMSAAELFAAAAAGHSSALALVHAAAACFGRALYNLATTLDLRVFAIGGSVWQHHSDLLQPLVAAEIACRLPALTAGVEVRSAALAQVVADIGAFCLVLPQDWKTHWQESRPWNRSPAINDG